MRSLHCAECGYDLRGVPGRDGLLTCPECGTPYSNGGWARPRSRWIFVLGAVLPNYVMAALGVGATLAGEPIVGVCVAMPIAAGTLLITPLLARELEHVGDTVWIRQGRAFAWWLLFNVPTMVVHFALAR